VVRRGNDEIRPGTKITVTIVARPKATEHFDNVAIQLGCRIVGITRRASDRSAPDPDDLFQNISWNS
jgi:hypothetical protein